MKLQQDFIKMEGKIRTHHVLHNRSIQIASLNIHDLNQRFDNELEVIYVVERFKFEPSDYTHAANYNVVELLNKFISWDLSEGGERQYQLTNFLRFVQNTFEELNTELYYRQLTNTINDSDKERVEVFMINYQSFAPVGILSQDEEILMKVKLNQYCTQLKSNFLSELEKPLDLEIETSESKTIVTQNSTKNSITDSNLNISQIFKNYFKRKPNEESLWSRLISS